LGTFLGPNNIRTGTTFAGLKQGTFMGIQHLSDRALLVTLPREPHSGAELQTVAGMVDPARARHVIIDFSLVEIMPSEVICNLMVLDRVLGQIDRQLVLCSVAPQIREVFRRVELGELFRFADDEFAALQSLDRCLCHG
jgi:anti-anti-sigma regulatory factor